MWLLRPVMAGRTTIVITHDPSVAAAASQIVTLGAPVSRARLA
jgi:ABC-type lipoprotein export system ATPase subunit